MPLILDDPSRDDVTHPERMRFGTGQALKVLAAVSYLTSIVGANWLTARYGFTPVGFGLAATAGTYLAGLAFVARDALQDTAGRTIAVVVLALGAGLSWFASTPQLALASAVAFGVSELADMAVYTPLRRGGYVRAAIASNLAGAVVDTYAFLTLAGFAITPLVVGGQIIGKAWTTVAAVTMVVMVRALLRHRVRTHGA